jgi:PAS domain S-box-containing protein
MKESIKILFVEDVLTDAELNWREIEKSGIAFDRLLVDNKKDYLDGLKSFSPDMIISDYSLPQFDGMSALMLRNELCPSIPFILVTGSINEEVAVECMRAGANDYILKERLSRLGLAVTNSINKVKLQEEKNAAEKSLRESEERYRRLVEGSPYAIAVHAKGKFVYVNSAAVKLIGAGSPQDLIGTSVIDIIHPDSRSMVINRLTNLEKGKEAPLAEEKFVKFDGSVIDVEVVGIPFVYQEEIATQVVVHDISSRKETENELKNSLSLMEATLQSIHNGILVVSHNGTVIKANDKFAAMWHIPDEVLASGDDNILLASILDQLSDKDEFIAKVKELYENPDSESLDLITFKDGHVLERISKPMYLGNEPKGRVWSFLDITDRKRDEERIVHERRMLRALIDNIPDLIYVKDIECRKVISNIADVRNSGFKKEKEILGKTDIELYSGETGQRGYDADIEVIRSGIAIHECEEDFVDKNGLKHWIQTSKIPLHDKDGKISGLVGIGHDITERKQAEIELRHSYEFNASLLKTIPFGMDIVDETGTVLFQSDNFKRLFGVDVIGKKCWDLYHDNKEQCKDCPLKSGIKIGETDAYESYGVLGERIFEISHTGMMYQGKTAMLEIFQDITERKRSEEELIFAKNKAEEGDKLKTAFLHNISHEIRTPMNAIVGFAALLGEPDLDAQDRQDYTEVIVQSSNHLLEIITDIVDISNIEANLVRVVKNEINVNSTLKSLYHQFIPKANEKKVKLIFESALSDSDALILTDSTKLRQILVNLISNAMKFTAKGSIKISYKIKDTYMEFCVKDTGIGIAEEFHSKIFERFYQILHNFSKLYEGTGLGLAISKANVELMGGKIWLTSEPGVGTTFYFTIPYEKRILENPKETDKSPKQYLAFTEKKKILVAEDIESNFKLICYFLSGSNTEVIRAVNGKEAVEKCLADKSIDLILMDIKMPVMDGYTAIKLIRETNTVIPIIAQTAYFDDKEPALEAGSSGFISKPFDKKGLLKIVHEFI